MCITFYCIQVQNRSVTNRQQTNTIHNLFCLNNGRNIFFPDLNRTGLNNIHTLVKAFIFFQVVDTGVNNDTSDPALKGSFILKRMHLKKNFYKTFLKHILSILAVMCKPVTYCQHFWTVAIVQLLLRGSVIFQTTL